MKTDCSPNRLRKYHDKDETHRTSRSRVATPDCSIDLKRMVRGKGSFTVQMLAHPSSHHRPTLSFHPSVNTADILITKPAKNALIQPIITVCGTIIIIFPFIMPIMPSMAAGSVIGFAAGFPLFSGSLRKVPAL